MADKNRTRILLQHRGQIKKFAFISPRSDGSFYFGAAFSPRAEARVGSIKIPLGEKGTTHVKFSDAKEIEPLDAKFSYHPAGQHPSAVIHLKNKLGHILFRCPVTSMEEMGNYRKLATIVASDPQNMPPFEEPTGPYDTIIPTDGFCEKPFRAALFICRKEVDPKELFIKGASKAAMAVSENNRFQFVVELYQKADFQTWPRLMALIPYTDGIDVN